MLYCIAENRNDCEVGLRYLLVTLKRFCPNSRIVVYRPEPCDDFKSWLQKIPQVEHIRHFPSGGEGWNCKPHALLPLLENGEKEVIWLDSDIMLTRNPESLFSGLSSETLVAVEDSLNFAQQGTEIRTRGWNLPVGRSLARTLNSGVLRVTYHHVPLLKRWQELLGTPEYLIWNTQEPMARPIHLRGDQDVLTALIGSTEFADIPVHLLRSGIDVLYNGGTFGYPLSERFAGLWHPIPSIIHEVGIKPWFLFDNDLQERLGWKGSLWWYRRLMEELSPYLWLCRRYRSEIDLPTPWLDKHSSVGLFFRALGFEHYALSGLPLVVFVTVLRQMGLLRI